MIAAGWPGSTRLIGIIVAALFCFLAACSYAGSLGPSPANTPATLPAPRVQVIRVTTTSVPVMEKTTRPTFTATPSSVNELARSVYGTRLIDWIEIPRIKVLAPVSAVGWMPVSDGQYGTEIEWDSPDAGVGWVVSSALPGDEANIVLYGHNNLNASVFLKLGELESGDQIRLATGEQDWFYQVDKVKILPVSDDIGMQAAYQDSFAPGDRAQLTLVSCWPPTGNTYRAIVVAYPKTEQ